VPDALIADVGRLRQVIVNLVGNSLKFTEQGEVVVYVELASGGEKASSSHQTADSRNGGSALTTQHSVPSTHNSVHGAENKPGSPSSTSPSLSASAPPEILLHFAIKDTGIGIPQEKIDLIFDPFTQADGSTTRKYGGTGLGLTICRRLVELMGGRIWVESEPGKGSAFHFTARLGVQQGSSVQLQLLPPERLMGLPILVVDDNATNRRIMEEMLNNWRFQPTIVANGELALTMLKQAVEQHQPFPIVLLDAMMPEMDGFTLAERIRDDATLGKPTILMLSSADRPMGVARSRDLGIARYLTKPVKQSDLLDAIVTALATGVPAKPPESRKVPIVSKELLENKVHKPQVLLVEDNAVNQKLAVRVLEKQGYKVAVANNGQEGVELWQQEKFDVILMDVQMPVMGGFEATAAIRELERGTGRHIPIIAMTAHAMKGDRERCLEAGMDGYVTKPIQAKELFAAITELTACLGVACS
jgi:CheY-like chemotaxis protein